MTTTAITGLVSFGAAAALSAVVLRTDNQLLRYSWPGLLFALVRLAFLSVPSLTPSAGFQSAIMLFLQVWVLHITALLLLEPKPLKSGDQSLTWLDAVRLLFDFRRIAQKRIQQKANNHNDTKERRPTSSVSRGEFFLRRGIRSALAFCAFYLYESNAELIIETILMQLWSMNESVPEWAAEPLLFGTFNSILVVDFILSTFLINNFFHSLFAICSVCVLGIDTPEEWPLIWGTLLGASSVRGYWGRFWHRLVAHTFRTWTLAVFSVVRIDPKSYMGGQLMRVSIFLISGICHGLATWGVGQRCGWWADIAWFVLQAVAMWFEDIIDWLMVRVVGSGLTKSSFARYFGFVWTWAFLAISIPRLHAAKERCAPYSEFLDS
jgi:hypothetical protein